MVDQYEYLVPHPRMRARAMRKLIKEAEPVVVDEWKWMGTPVWLPGGRTPMTRNVGSDMCLQLVGSLRGASLAEATVSQMDDVWAKDHG